MKEYTQEIEVGRTFRTEGYTYSVSKVEEQPIEVTDVAHHEAAHAVAAGTIILATIIASGNALGHTIPVEMTPAAAGAAAAMGHDGVSWDLFLAAYILGVSISYAIAAGRAALSGKEQYVERVARKLQIKKTIHQGDMDEAYQEVADEQAGNYAAKIVRISPDGKQKVTHTEAKGNRVVVALPARHRYASLPKAA